jgi:hypothetical protein
MGVASERRERATGAERGAGVPARDGVGGSGPPPPRSGSGAVSPEPAWAPARAKADGAKPPGKE